MKDFNYEIVEHIATLSKSEGKTAMLTKEINLVSFNGSEPKYDIRVWQHIEGAEPKMLKGITLDKEEFEALKEAVLR